MVPGASGLSSVSSSGRRASDRIGQEVAGALIVIEQRQHLAHGPPDRPPPAAATHVGSFVRRRGRAPPRTVRARACCPVNGVLGVIGVIESGRRVAQLAKQPRPRERPAPLERRRRHVQRRGRFLDAQAAEKAQLDDAGLLGIDCSRAARALRRAPAASSSSAVAPISESTSDTRSRPPHRFCAPRARARSTRICRIERAAIPTKWRSSFHGVPGIGQPEVGLVDEGGRLDGLARPLAAHVRAGEAPQLVVDEHRQFVGRLRRCPSPPCFDQL